LISDPLQVEFGRYTEWILEAVEAVGIDDPIPVACRGTADVSLFEDLAHGIGARPGLRVLDVGCGLGGPAAWLRRTHGCRVVGIDLMEQAARAARRLFDRLDTVAGSSYALPFRPGAFDAIWAVGVLELIEDKARALAEMARVLVPGGRVALYSHTTEEEEELVDPPLSDHFVSSEEVAGMAAAAGFRIGRSARVATGPRADEPGHALRSAVEAEVRRRHGTDPDFELVRAELGRFARLRATEAVRPWRFDLALPG
jgi:SAM-dependent methyltransferase